MPQARTAGTSTSKPTAAKRTPAKPAASRSAAAKPAASKTTAAKAKPAAAKPAAKPAAAKPAAAKTAAKTAAKPAANAAAKPAAARAAAKPAAAKPAAAKSAGASKMGGASSRPRVHIDAAQVEQIAARLRKLNEKIIDFGREAGENTLASYEKALKTIATGVEQSPAKDELEWIAHLATSQAKFVREITDSWTKAARYGLK